MKLGWLVVILMTVAFLSWACGASSTSGDNDSSVDAPADTAGRSVDTSGSDSTLADLDTEPDAGQTDKPWWDRLEPSGLPLQQIAGIASQMSTRAEPDVLRNFEYEQYAPYPGFRMRNGHTFSDVQPNQGEWHWEKVTGAVDGAKAVGAKVLMGLDYGVRWAQDTDDVGTIHIDDFAEYAGAMAGYFCDDVKEYEVWNEPNILAFWRPEPDPVKYADLLIAASAAIRSACPDARVAFGGLASFGEPDIFDTWAFLTLALEARPGLCEHFDVLALHPYTWFQTVPPEHDKWMDDQTHIRSQVEMTRRAREILQDHGCGSKPIWFTEVGFPTFDIPEETVAPWAVRSLLLTAMDGVEAWCWYTFWDFDPVTDGLRPHEHYFGMFGWVGPDGTWRRPKPAWEALTASLDRLGHYRYAGTLTEDLNLPNDVYVLAFTDDNYNIALAAWDGREVPDVTPDGPTPGGEDTSFEAALPIPQGFDLSVYDIYGNEIEIIPVENRLNLILTSSVTYIMLGKEGD